MIPLELLGGAAALVTVLVLAAVIVVAVRAGRAGAPRTKPPARPASASPSTGSAWLTGRTEEPPEVPVATAAPAGEPVVAPLDPEWVVSPRRRLWRDTSAVLLVGVVGVLLVGIAPAPRRLGGGRGARGDGDAATDRGPHPDAVTHAVTHAATDRDPHPDAVTHPHSHPDAVTDPDRQADAEADEEAGRPADRAAHAPPDAEADAEADAAPHPDAEADPAAGGHAAAGTVGGRVPAAGAVRDRPATLCYTRAAVTGWP